MKSLIVQSYDYYNPPHRSLSIVFVKDNLLTNMWLQINSLFT